MTDNNSNNQPGGGQRRGDGNDSAVLAAISEVRSDVGNLRQDFTTFRNNLADSYMPRREAETLFRELRDIGSALRTDMVAIQEWRLSQTQQAATNQQNIQAQIQAAVISAMEKNNDLKVSTVQQQVSTVQQQARQRAVLDERTIGMLQAGLFVLISVGLAFILSHLLK